MISAALQREIEAYALELLDRGVLFNAARHGKLTPDAIAVYVANLRLLVQHTEINLRLARDRAEQLGMPDLAKHFAHKLSEEVGHERWAENDLASLRADFRLTSSVRVSSSIKGLLAYLREAIGENPVRYLAYILFAEYLTVLVGPELLALLEQRCGIPQSSMTIVGRHAELDKLHVSEGVSEIDALVTDDNYLAPLLETLGRSMQYFDSFCAEICAVGVEGTYHDARA
jgi:hypothetical protein